MRHRLIDTKYIREKMNELGMAQKPFLVLISYDLSEGMIVENPLEQDEVLFKFLSKGNKKASAEDSCTKAYIKPLPTNYSEYKDSFDFIIENMHRQNIEVINFTVKTQVETNLPLSAVFERSTSPYQIFMPDAFVCFSPERFIRIDRGYISANPMKGTIDANLPDAEKRLLNDVKEIAEHTSTVKLISEELAQVATDVCTKRFRYVDKIDAMGKNLLQVSSEIVGKLEPDYQLGDVLFKLLPAGSIVGYPKSKVLSLIKKTEQEERGYYCGIAGYFDGETFDSAVLIRFIETANGKLFFRSGSGITTKSVCEKEYNEVLDKIYLPFI